MKTMHVVLLAAALAAPSTGVEAQGKGKGNKGKPAKADKADRADKVVFVEADRQAARDWYRSSYGRNCPPGLAKKNNGCLPPGQAKKRYSVGTRLPDDVMIKTIPTGLRLSAAPAGYRYVYVDGDVLLMNATSRVVADVIEHLLD